MLSLIALSGLPGSGKTTASKFLQAKGYEVVYMGRLTGSVIKEGDLESTPENEKYIRDNLRKKYGKDIFARMVLPVISERIRKRKSVVVEGLRSPEELKLFKKYFRELKVFFIDSLESIRYWRLIERKLRPFTTSQAKERDKEEIEVLRIGEVQKKADFILENNNDKKEFYKSIEEII